MKYFTAVFIVVSCLLSACAIKSDRTQEEWTICFGIMSNDPKVLPELRKRTRADLNRYWASPSGFPMTPLYLAACHGNEEVVKILIERKIDVDKGSENDNVTPLMGAVNSGMRGVSKLLLDAGANPNSISPDGSTLLDISFYDDTPEIGAMLVQHGAKFLRVTKEPQNAESSAAWLAKVTKMSENTR